MRIKVDVTAEDIKKGRREVPTYCPVALAVKRVLGMKTGVRVWGTTIGLGPNEKQVKVGESVEHFVGKFDNHVPVLPFSFNLDLPKKLAEKLIGIPVPAEMRLSNAVVTKGAKVEVAKEVAK